MSLLSPLALLGALLAVPIILLYMLRLRRREVLVSSNFLWQQILRDREANTPWQRLRRNILLILQLLILALIVLALARPVQIVPQISASKTVILLDASASMNATDVEGGTRFQAAQQEARQIISELSAGDEFSIIRVADVTEPLIQYTDDINALRGAINSAQPGQGSGDWDTALTLAAAGAEGAESFSMIIISDGGLGDVGQLPENIPQPVYIPVGISPDNVAITALATRALPGQNPQLFTLVDNYTADNIEVSLVIRLDGALWDSATRPISANSQRSFVFTINEEFSVVEAELVLDDTVIDHLVSDNHAFSVASETRTRRILLLSDQSNIFLEQVLRSLPGGQVFRGDTSRSVLPEQAYDLYIFNNWLPATLPAADMLIMNPPTSTALFTLGAEVEGIRDVGLVNRSHPLSAFLNVENINVRALRSVSNADWAQPIIRADDDALVLAGEDAGRQIMLLPFDILDTDLPLQIAWPLLMSNAMEWFAPANVISGSTAVSVGDTVRINPPLNTDTGRVTAPDGSVTELDVRGRSGLAFTNTQQAGIYTLDMLAQGQPIDTAQFAVNLFGTGESNIAPVVETDLQVGGGIAEAEAEEQLGFREFWPLLVGLGLLVMLYEWYLYYRRQQPSTTVQPDLRRTTARN